MSFKQFGGLNYAAKNNIIGNLYSTSVNSGTTNVIGQENSKIVCLSHLDMSANSVMHIGSLYFMDGTVQNTAYESSSGVPVFNNGIIVNNGSQLNDGVHVTGGLTTDSLTISSGGTQNSILYKNGSGITNFFDFGVGQATQTLSVNSGGNLEWTNSSNPGDGALSLTCSHSTSISGTFTANQTAGSTIDITLDATNANTPSTIVARDENGNFSAGTITASLTGNATTSTTATNLANGAAYSIPYQTGSSATNFIPYTGASGQVLTYNTGNIPSWQSVNATTIKTNSSTSDASFNLTFVDSSSGDSQTVYTSSDLIYNPSENLLTIDNLTVNNTVSILSLNINNSPEWSGNLLAVNGSTSLQGTTATNIKIIGGNITLTSDDGMIKYFSVDSTGNTIIGPSGGTSSTALTVNGGLGVNGGLTAYLDVNNFMQLSRQSQTTALVLSADNVYINSIANPCNINNLTVTSISNLNGGITVFNTANPPISQFSVDAATGDTIIGPSGGTSSTALQVNGTCTATSFKSSSDYRIKDDVQILDHSFNVDNLRAVTYTNKNTKMQDIGFIAHEVQEEFPYLVSGEKDGEQMQSLNYTGLIGVLVKEIQELKKRVHILENK